MNIFSIKSLTVLAVIIAPFSSLAMDRPASGVNQTLQKKFFSAVENGNIKEVKRLLKFRPSIDVNAQDENERPAIVTAIANGNAPMVELLLDAGVNPNQFMRGTMAPEQTLLMYAASSRDGYDMALALLTHGANPNAREMGAGPGRPGRTALDFARIRGNQDIIDLLQTKKTKLP